jgi:hypothetical protein
MPIPISCFRRFWLLALAPALLLSQTLNTGAFVGSVKDQSGAALTGAAVRISRDNPPFQREVTTDALGNYQALQVPPGEYRIEFGRTDFQTTVHTGIALSAGQSLRVDATLTVGAVAESVQISAQVAQVDTVTGNVGNTIFGNQVQELMLNTRYFTQLLPMLPGVTSTAPQQPNPGSGPGVTFNGGGGSNWLLDGGRNIDTFNGNNLTFPNLDAIAEVRIERSAYQAEYGRNAGAQINVLTRSGTNQFHGTLFEFFRNDHMDARNFFAAKKAANRYNNFGWTLGGPIKKDKLFFFLSNEYRPVIQAPATLTSTVPTAAQISGDFSGGRAITDPDTGAPFPGNRIPASRLDPNAQVLLKNYYALPTPGFQQGALNYTSAEPDRTHWRSALGRLDYLIKPNVLFFGRYNIDSGTIDSPYGRTSNVIPFVAAVHNPLIPYSANGTLNWTINPTTLNQFTMAWFHGSLALSVEPYASRRRVPGFNVPRVFSSFTAGSSDLIPSITMAQGYAGIVIGWPQNISHSTFEVLDNVSRTVGRHQLKFGGSIDKENKSQNNANPNNNGTFTFNGSVTGDSLADLALGKAFQYTENSAHVFGRSWFTNYSLYVQDQFLIRPRLSLTYGVRWEFFQPEQDNDQHYSFFQPSRFDRSKAATVLPNGQIVTGTENFGNGVVIVGDGAPFGHGVFNTTWNTFAPRGGFSYSLTKDNLTVVRGGFGMFHDRWPQNVSQLRNNYPFTQVLSIFNTSFSNPAQGTQRLFPIAFTNFNSPWRIPYFLKGSLGVQRQLPAEVLLDVSYVGTRGVSQVITRDTNQPLPSLPVANGQVSANAVRPFPGFAGITTYETSGNTIYHSLQTSVTRRFFRGFSLQGSYTFSKTLTNAVTPVNSYANSRLERGLSSADRTHVLMVSYVYELPFGQHLQGLARNLLHGWQVSGITSLNSGLPLTVTIPGDRAGVGSTGQRPNLVAPVERLMTLARWFNTEAFANPALATFGNAARSIVRGPGINNWDLSLSKRFAVREKVNVQFRGEFFNIFNHAQFSGVVTSLGGATFGQVNAARDSRITQLGLRLMF